MNYLHQHYQKPDQIKNVDVLYTLSLFALEPVRWIHKHEWRDMTDIERCGNGIFGKAMGDAMLMAFDDLQSSKT